MRIAHATPFAGHLGREKTLQRLLQCFYWPGIFQDIAHYCWNCPVCQRSGAKGARRAPLIPLPIIATPFKRIAMDTSAKTFWEKNERIGLRKKRD